MTRRALDDRRGVLPPFTVQFGVGPAGVVVQAEAAGAAVSYGCPACATPLILKAGLIRRHHFVHRVTTAGCSPESALHEGRSAG